MTDKELLELAAKAAGLKIDTSKKDGFMSGSAVLDWDKNIMWNPLFRDGDALRLAVTPGMMIDCSTDEGWCDIISCGSAVRVKECYEDSDKFVATRRAIVMAAAQIGKSMQ